MWHRPWRILILTLAVNVIAAACGGGGSPAAPSVEPGQEPEMRSFSGQWRGKYRNGSLDVMSRCLGQGPPLDFYNVWRQGGGCHSRGRDRRLSWQAAYSRSADAQMSVR